MGIARSMGGKHGCCIGLCGDAVMVALHPLAVSMTCPSMRPRSSPDEAKQLHGIRTQLAVGPSPVPWPGIAERSLGHGGYTEGGRASCTASCRSGRSAAPGETDGRLESRKASALNYRGCLPRLGPLDVGTSETAGYFDSSPESVTPSPSTDSDSRVTQGPRGRGGLGVAALAFWKKGASMLRAERLQSQRVETYVSVRSTLIFAWQ